MHFQFSSHMMHFDGAFSVLHTIFGQPGLQKNGALAPLQAHTCSSDTPLTVHWLAQGRSQQRLQSDAVGGA